ncbi:MAG: type I methionyl aminopeptidase [Candidatus Blackburnbacteria bacterium RIFCSPHIGHO2_12_FULL_41_13b]|uniref:Methionine aminopeptidase n=1 Tax=Candidatus Blackburnbacteria bacterium RIFCSPHIGHO2_12_FULL_41_13b TaxID=1797517 RepID=A0A1G1V9L7_9BACT|nr:MAG: type I methionyl aminopeptidase [Candidatus Blackburnbacteria bacterium RIFCSPHIGHO2_12_FULL_41_13b]
MIHLKTPQEIKIMREGGKRLGQVKAAIREMLAPGVIPCDIDRKAEELMEKAGGQPSFKKVRGYHWATCININDGVVHGVPSQIPFEEGDLVKVDLGLFYQGLHTDTSFTFFLGKIDPDKKKFLEIGKEALNKAIVQAKPGNRMFDISHSMQEVLEGAGYSPTRSLTGHGIGRELHEDPPVPCLWVGRGRGELLAEGMVLAIEAIYTLGSSELILSSQDNWTISTKDGKIAGYFEETVAITANGPLVLTA